MRRLPERDRVDVRLAEGRLRRRHVRAVARSLAALHARAPRVAPQGEPADALRACIGLRVADFEGLARSRSAPAARAEAAPPLHAAIAQPPPDAAASAEAPDEATARALARAERWQLEQVERSEALLVERAASGRLRDGHGDLALDRVFVAGDREVRVVSRLDAAPAVRGGDVCADVAAFASALAAEGRSDHAELFLAEYARAAADYDAFGLVDLYASLAASTRARLELACARVRAPDERASAASAAAARRCALLAVSAPLRPLLPPVVVAIGGEVATGKTTAAKWIARRVGAPFVTADRVRSELLGGRRDGAHHEVHWERAYAPGFGERVYAEVVRRARAVLASGRPVLLDGCFRSRAQRALARALAREFGHPFLFVEVCATAEAQRARLLRRARRDGEPASTWLEIARALRREWEPPVELPDAERMRLDASAPRAELVAQVRARIPTWPRELTG
ncbi:MAG: AAA family ATPase [Myxococcota bacterium]